MTRGSESEQSGYKGSIDLGLYLCRQITVAHGGTIDVTLDEKGKTFRVAVFRQSSFADERMAFDQSSGLIALKISF